MIWSASRIAEYIDTTLTDQRSSTTMTNDSSLWGLSPFRTCSKMGTGQCQIEKHFVWVKMGYNWRLFSEIESNSQPFDHILLPDDSRQNIWIIFHGFDVIATSLFRKAAWMEERTVYQYAWNEWYELKYQSTLSSSYSSWLCIGSQPLLSLWEKTDQLPVLTSLPPLPCLSETSPRMSQRTETPSLPRRQLRRL